MPCGGALSTLISIVISGKVRDAQWPLNGVNAGDDVTLSFLAEPDVLVRNIAGQGMVQDGIAPYKVCSDGFALDFGSSKAYHMELGALPVGIDGTPSSVWFSLMQQRVVWDGAWVSTDPADESKGFPLTAHGIATDSKGVPVETFGGVFGMSFDPQTVKTLDLAKAVGEYGANALHKATLHVWRGWESNTVIDIEFGQMKIQKASDAKSS